MMKTRQSILIAEDDANFGMMLKIFLEMNGYRVRLCGDGEEAYQVFKEDHFDLGIFDVMMPLVDGFSLADRISKINKHLPFIFLTAKALKEDQIRGYKIGALDYLIKPFDPEILLLKLKVLLPHAEKTSASNGLSFTIGSFVFDYPKRALDLAGEVKKLSPKEAELLKLLCEKEGEVLPHTEAMIKIWKNDDYFTKQSMNVFISKLRKYLSKDKAHTIEITNLHSTGFILQVR
ncbi:MAG: response regulator transcription factor [Saprospiraceae bacterium]|nr:response regulator transcription factor [Saprospiraceae bacterium]